MSIDKMAYVKKNPLSVSLTKKERDTLLANNVNPKEFKGSRKDKLNYLKEQLAIYMKPTLNNKQRQNKFKEDFKNEYGFEYYKIRKEFLNVNKDSKFNKEKAILITKFKNYDDLKNRNTKAKNNYKSYDYNLKGKTISQIRSEINEILDGYFLVNKPLKNNKYRFVVPIVDSSDNEVVVNSSSSVFKTNVYEAFEDFMRKLAQFENQYNRNNAVYKFIFEVLTFNEEAGGNATRSIETANKTWKYILNKRTKTNCLYSALVLCNNPEKVDEYIENIPKWNNLSKKYKRRIQPIHDHYADNVDIQKCSDYFKKPIILYNNVYERINTFEPVKYVGKKYAPRDAIEIQRKNNHYIALIRWGKDEVKPNDYKPVKTLLNDDTSPTELYTDKDKIIKYKSLKPIETKIASYDIECTPDIDGTHKCYGVGMAWYENNEIMYKEFWGLNAQYEFFEYLHIHKDYFNNYTFYAHNGGKYDITNAMKEHLLDSHFWMIKHNTIIEQNNSFINVDIQDYTGKSKINFKDSLRMIAGSLDKLCKEFNTKYQKLTETVNHNDITLDNFNNFPQLHKYLEHDVKGLLEIVVSFNKSVYELSFQSFSKTDKKTGEQVQLRGGINITECATSASLSRKLYFNSYYNGFHTPVYTLKQPDDSYIRNGYFGGRVELTALGEINKPLYYLDFTSLYPDVGRKNLPYGIPEKVVFNNQISRSFFGFIRCMVRTLNTKVRPLHGIKHEGKLIFPIFENWTEITLFSEEYFLGLDQGIYEYKLIDGLKFSRNKFMSKIFNDMFVKKAESKKNNKPTLAQAYKIIINSLYGFWGMKTNDKDNIKIFPAGDSSVFEFLQNGKLINESDVGNYTILRVLEDLPLRDINVGVACAITSHARMKLWSLIHSIETKGGKVYMCDTDSVITDYNVVKDKELQEKFIPDLTGDELGSLKNELVDDANKAFKKKGYTKEQIDAIYKQSGIHFDKGVFAGCKFYTLHKEFCDGTVVSVNKCKGYKQTIDDKLNYEKFTNLFSGTDIQQQQTQFKCPKSNYVSETNTFNMKTPKVHKKFGVNYTKGNTNDFSNITPLKI